MSIRTVYSNKEKVSSDTIIESGVLTINGGLGSFFEIEMTENITELVFSNIPTEYHYIADIRFVQDTTGGWSIDFSSTNVVWDNNSEPVLPATANTFNNLVFDTNDGILFLGLPVALEVPIA